MDHLCQFGLVFMTLSCASVYCLLMPSGNLLGKG